MIMKANKQIGFIYKNNESIDKILKDGDVVFERGFLREKTSTTLPIAFGGVGKNLKDYKVYGNTVQNGTPTPDAPIDMVSCGDRTKNLIGFEDLPETTSNGVTYSIKDNVFTLNGTATKHIRYIYNNKYYLGNEGDYTLKIDAISGSWTAGIIGLSLRRKSDGEQELYHQLAYNTTNLRIVKAYTQQNIDNTIRIGFYINKNSVFNNFKFRIIYNEGSTSQDYEPYGYKIPINVNNSITNIYLDEPLRKIGEYSDYIDFKNGKVARNIEEYILIGDEQIKMIREGMNCIKIDGKNIRTGTNTMPPIFCNMLLANSRNSIYQGNVGIGYGEINNEYYNDIVMRVPNITTLTDFTTWLQSNNVTVDYVLATPTKESITLPNIPTIDRNNTLNIETEITPSQVYIKYKSNS